MVIEDGCDEEALKKSSAEPKDEILAKIAEDVLTPGVWPCYE